ncbi:MAG: prolyl oligopeptidase family serine peptidase [Gemmatimonadota bacterium]
MLLVPPASTTAQTPQGPLTVENVSAIRYPASPAWSPDGSRVAFLWDAAGKQDLYVTVPGQEPIQLTDFPVDPHTLESNIGRFAWVDDSRILFGKDGQLWTVGVPSSSAGPGGVSMAARAVLAPSRVSELDNAGDFVLSDDGSIMAFTRQGDLWTASVEALTQRRVTYLPEGLQPSAQSFSRDGMWVAISAARRWMEEEPLPYNGTIVRTFRSRSADERLGIVSVRGGDPIWVPLQGSAGSVQWTADGSLLFQETSADRKTRWIRVFTPGEGVRTLWTDYDPAWWSVTGRDSRTVVSPDGSQVAFVSDRTGWPHVYVMPVSATSEGAAVQLSSGNFGAGLPAWSPDGRSIAFHHSADGNQMERFVSVVEVGSRRVTPVVTAPGLSFDPLYSPTGERLALLRTDPQNSQDVYVVQAPGGGGAAGAGSGGALPVSTAAGLTRLSNSMPPEIRDPSMFTVPEPVHFPSRVDGQMVPSTIMIPEGLDRSQRHPAIVWIHGSGSDQNFLGWHPGAYRMYYAVHQYLAQQGYIILTPDYRGSSGYDRDWATGHYMDLGGDDYLDVASGADYLKTLDFVDPDRIGVWGLSYGGFMTLQALTVTPTLFACGINVAGVGDWATWSTSGWITGRMGTPAENPEIFHRLAPTKHMEHLVRPLLVLHGTADVNVAFRESLTLVDQLLKLGKDFDNVVYPGEAHFFRRYHVLRDAWTRAERFFDSCLR